MPLVACDDGQGVDEEDLDDLNDADNGAAHPQAQLATDVGQKHLDLQGRPSQTIRRDPRQVGFMQRPQFPRESLAGPGPEQVWGKMGAAFLSPLTLPDLRLGWPLVTLRAQAGPPQSDSAPQGPGQVPGGSHSRCWQGSPRWISGSGLCRISKVWPSLSCKDSNRWGQGELEAFALYQMDSLSAWLSLSCPAPSTDQALSSTGS